MRTKQEIKEMLKKLNLKEEELAEEYRDLYIEYKENNINLRLLTPMSQEIKDIRSYIEMLEWILNDKIINKYE